jgi:hypothetical protein
MKLVMKDLDVDTYTATFKCLAAAADWEPDAKGTIAHYRQGLRENVHRRILNRENLPADMAGWKEAAHKEVNRIREIQNAGLAGFHGNQRPRDQTPFQSNQTCISTPVSRFPLALSPKMKKTRSCTSCEGTHVTSGVNTRQTPSGSTGIRTMKTTAWQLDA